MSKNSNTAGLARKAVPNGSTLLLAPFATSEGGVVSFRVYRATVAEDGSPVVRNVTGLLKNTPGADGAVRGRPRKDNALRAAPVDRLKASTVLGRQIGSALYGDESTIKVQEL